MAKVLTTGLVLNRNELYQGNRDEPIAPNVTQEILNTEQVFANQSIPGNKVGPVFDTGNAGVTSVGDKDTDVRYWAGATYENRATAPFRVLRNGYLYASAASIPAPSTIAGFDIGADYIRDAANSMGLASTVTVGDDVRFWAGATFVNRATAPFNVTEAGVLTSTSALLGGWTVGTNSITAPGGIVGLSSTITAGDDIRIWAGHITPSSAPFYVTEAGNVTASNITATGTIYATAGFIGSATALVYESQGINTGVDGHIRGGQTDYDTGNGYFLGYSGGAYKFSIGAGGTASNNLRWDGTNLYVNNRRFTSDPTFGDGSDGNVTISTNTALTRDMFYDQLIVNQITVTNEVYQTEPATRLQGYALHTNANQTWATIKGGAGTSYSNSDGNLKVGVLSGANANTWTTIWRAAVFFDTSALPDDLASITSAKVRLYVKVKNDNLSQSLRLTRGQDNSIDANGDYATLDDTVTAESDTDVTIASATVGQWIEFPLNAAGIAAISKTTYTYFGVLLVSDATNSAPGYQTSLEGSLTFASVDDASNKPQLLITYLTNAAPALNPAGFKIFAKTSVVITAGGIARNGAAGGNAGAGGNASGITGGTPAGTSGAGSAALANGSIYGSFAAIAGPAGQVGVAGQSSAGAGNPGGNGTNGTAGTAATSSLGSDSHDGGVGIAGGNGGSSGAGVGGTGGTAGTLGAKGATTIAAANIRNLVNAVSGFDTAAGAIYKNAGQIGGQGGSGSGGSGRFNTTGPSGGSGASGGAGGNGQDGAFVLISSPSITVGASGYITANGGNGGNGGKGGNGGNASGQSGGGGGGGGGSAGQGGHGGRIVLIYTTYSNSGTVTASAGTKGTPGGQGAGGNGAGGGSAGAPGLAGTAALDGNAGVIYQLQLL